MSDLEKTYQQGMIDALALWGRVCGSTGNCDSCPIGNIRGAGVTCQDFARQFPAKMLSLLKEMDKGEITYYQEFCMRFPDCNHDVEIVAQMACRKAVFEGSIDCNPADMNQCIACWNAKYVGDVDDSE